MPRKLTDPVILRKARAVKLVIFDVDGVLTDGRIILDNAGNELKAFNVRDGHGIKMLTREGIGAAIITGRSSEVVMRRAGELGIEHVIQGSKNKFVHYQELIEKLGMKPEETAFVGDDIVDLPVMVRAGLSVAVADAHDAVRERADAVTTRRAGRGAAREVCDMILTAKGLMDGILKKYSQV